jgi:hypothetical protein
VLISPKATILKRPTAATASAASASASDHRNARCAAGAAAAAIGGQIDLIRRPITDRADH